MRRRGVLWLFLIGPLALAFYGFSKQQILLPSWPDIPVDAPYRGLIQTHDGTVLAEGPAESRRYPMNHIGAHIIGFSGKKQDGGNYGLEGLEFTLDPRLTEGETITLTIDARMQAIAQKNLRETIQEFEAENGSIVILEAGTGRILAAASYPEFDPNKQNLVTDRSIIQHKAFLHTFEPGSVMKPFVVAAALESKRWPSDRLVESPMTLRVGDKTFSDVVQHEPWLNIWDVLKYSSNTGMIRLSQEFSDEDLYAWLSHFGFGQGIQVPSIYSRDGTLRDTPWFDQDKASITIGQSLSTTNLQLAANYSIFANKGYYVTPYLVEGDSVPSPQQRLSEGTADAIMTMMTYVVGQSNLKKSMVSGISVAGKTGTADIFDSKTGTYIDGDYNVTFAGIVPANDPKITMIVTVQKPRTSGSSTVVAAPLFGRTLNDLAPLLNLPVSVSN